MQNTWENENTWFSFWYHDNGSIKLAPQTVTAVWLLVLRHLMFKSNLPRFVALTRNCAPRRRTFATTPIKRDAIYDATESAYRNHVSTIKDKLVIVDFYEDWCPPCKILSPLLERVEQDPSLLDAPPSSIDLITIKGDLTPQLFEEYKIRAIPTIKAFYNGKQVGEFVGAKDLKGMKEWYSTLVPRLK